MTTTTASRRASAVDDRNDDLQRALEVELVNHLRAQTAQLMDELDKVKTLMSKSGNGSNSSWSEVGGASACAGIPPENVDGGGHGRGDFQTPRSSQKTEKRKRDVRFTPNGTPSLTERPLVVLGQSHVMFHNHHLSDHAFLLSTVLHV